MTDRGNTIDAAGSPEEETEAAGGEDIYGADGDAGTAARPDDLEADSADPVRADSGTGTTPEEEEDSSGG